MRAIVVNQPGPPEMLEIQERPLPVTRSGWVRIRVRAFGINRSELFTRQGHSGVAVQFPRVLGIECVGEVDDPADSHLRQGQTVAAVMGGMGRDFDGSYAEYCLLPLTQIMPVNTRLSWPELAALPESYLTAWGCLVDALQVRAGHYVVIRGGSSSVGMASIALARNLGCMVAATTRNPQKFDTLKAAGADYVMLDGGEIALLIEQTFGRGADRILDLIGTGTLCDSLRSVTRQGVVCMAGMLGGQWAFEQFEPVVAIPSTVRLTAYTTHIVTAANSTARLQWLVEQAENGRIPLNIDRQFLFEDIVSAHGYMEHNLACGKLVVMTA